MAMTLVLFGASNSANAAGYMFFDLGGDNSVATSINNSGQIVGYSYVNYFTEHATEWNGTTATDLGTLGGNYTNSRAFSINDIGQVVGNSYNTNYPVAQHAALWNGTTATDLGTLGGSNSVAFAINHEGQIAGNSDTTANNSQAATLWNGSSVTNLGTLGGSGASANSISDAGQVVGGSATTTHYYDNGILHIINHATLWNGTAATDLGTVGGNNSSAMAINNAGQVAGWSDISGNATYHATLWNGTSATDLGTLGTNSVATAINNLGEVVGYSSTLNNSAVHAFLWNGTSMTDLNSLLDSATESAGWVLNSANDINDYGWIVGSAYNSITGANHAYLLSVTAVPEADTYALMVAGFGLVSLVARRRQKQFVA